MVDDLRFAIGVNCAWFGDLAEAMQPGGPIGEILRRQGRTPPCCPHCGGTVKFMDSKEAFWANVDVFEAGVLHPGPPEAWDPRPHPGYRLMMDWAQREMFLRQMCFKHGAHMLNSYKKHTGLTVDLRKEDFA